MSSEKLNDYFAVWHRAAEVERRGYYGVVAKDESFEIQSANGEWSKCTQERLNDVFANQFSNAHTSGEATIDVRITGMCKDIGNDNFEMVQRYIEVESVNLYDMGGYSVFGREFTIDDDGTKLYTQGQFNYTNIDYGAELEFVRQLSIEDALAAVYDGNGLEAAMEEMQYDQECEIEIG